MVPQAQVSLPSDHEVRVMRQFGAPRGLVYQAYTTPELLQRVDPLLAPLTPLHEYEPGTDGPAAARDCGPRRLKRLARDEAC